MHRVAVTIVTHDGAGTYPTDTSQIRKKLEQIADGLWCDGLILLGADKNSWPVCAKSWASVEVEGGAKKRRKPSTRRSARVKSQPLVWKSSIRKPFIRGRGDKEEHELDGGASSPHEVDGGRDSCESRWYVDEAVPLEGGAKKRRRRVKTPARRTTSICRRRRGGADEDHVVEGGNFLPTCLKDPAH
jgi:hypothetical protein